MMLSLNKTGTLLIILSFSGSVFLKATFNESVEASIKFDREKMDARVLEWGNPPKANAQPWPTQQEFLERLDRIEKRFEEEDNSQIGFIRYRGIHPSHFERGLIMDLAMKTYFDKSIDGKTVSWPGGLGSYYVAKFNVKPSREFYRYVMNHPYGEINNDDVESSIQFDREKMSTLLRNRSHKVEGYWAGNPDTKRDAYDGHYPWPQANKQSWPTQQEFLERLRRIEKQIKAEDEQYWNNPRTDCYRERSVAVMCMEGWSYSRLEPEAMVGTNEYHDSTTGATIIWPEGYADHYIAKFNVKPSHEFYTFVMNHPYGEINNDDIESSIQFDREKMSTTLENASDKVEGYWANNPNREKDIYEGHYPWPQANKQSWPTQQEFLERLRRIEQRIEAEDGQSLVKVICMKGWALSRLEPEAMVGTKEYHDSTTGTTIIWPEGYADHYIAKFNVKPSHEFYTFVMNHPYGDAADTCSRCPSN